MNEFANDSKNPPGDRLLTRYALGNNSIRLTSEVEMAKLEPNSFLPLPLFPIANCDNMRIFCTLREPEIISDHGAHLSIPFY